MVGIAAQPVSRARPTPRLFSEELLPIFPKEGVVVIELLEQLQSLDIG